ncbi:MAG: DUF6517 family protein [Natronomonas sp.]
MDPTRRRFLAAGAAAGIATTAGCSGQTEFEAAGAPLSQATQDDTGFTEFRTETTTITREYEVFGIGRTVEVRNTISEYDRAVEILDSRLQAAVFTTLSTPQVRILTRTFNPIEDMTAVEIAEMIQERYDEIEDVTEEDSFGVSVAGQETTVTRFRTRARLIEGDATIEIYLYISEAVERGEDFVVTLTIHPQPGPLGLLFDTEDIDETVRTLTDGVDPA